MACKTRLTVPFEQRAWKVRGRASTGIAEMTVNSVEMVDKPDYKEEFEALVIKDDTDKPKPPHHLNIAGEYLSSPAQRRR